ncbi:hypothetical protein [Bacteroides sp. 519]|uniref:hypothetical protein n=1 Tax=Bacteroides sp. 519 TaxID=2302937 RepID=UPI0013D524EF|nr:hypothetical protein [Bacteroides sp. 519]NDV60168.1 hypothetical protein [Bacteroides sp. 519]
MKKGNLICLFFIILIIGCNNQKKNQEVDLDFEDEYIDIPFKYDPKDSVIVSLKIYEPKEDMKIILDSIVQIVCECSRIDLSKTDFVLKYDTISWKKPVMSISTTETRFYHNPAIDNGIFYHEGCRFYYEGIILKSFFKFTGNYEKVKAVNPEVFEMLGIDDSQLYWRYVVVDEQLLNYHYLNCDTVLP